MFSYGGENSSGLGEVSEWQKLSIRERFTRHGRWAVVGVVAVTGISAGVGVAAASTSPSQHKGPSASSRGRLPTSTPSPPLPAATKPNLCGPWSAANAQGMHNLVAAHGTLEACVKVASAWVLVTSEPSGLAEVGTMQCGTNPACLDGRKSRDLNRFTWNDGPAGRHLSLLAVQGDDLFFADMQGQESFKVPTSTWTPVQPNG